jgi:hypothetical protein
MHGQTQKAVPGVEPYPTSRIAISYQTADQPFSRPCVLRGHPCGKPGDMHGDTSPLGQRMIIGALVSQMSTPADKYSKQSKTDGWPHTLCLQKIFPGSSHARLCVLEAPLPRNDHHVIHDVQEIGGWSRDCVVDTDRTSDFPKQIFCGTR